MLIARCKAGDGQAFRELFERYYASTCRIAYGIVRQHALAEDVVQEAFLQAFRSIANLRPGEPFGPWFYRVVVRRARRSVEPRKLLFFSLDAWRNSGGDPADPVAEAQLADLGDRDAVWRAMAKLSPSHREVLVLRYAADLTEEQIARAAGIPSGTVKSRLHHARVHLAQRLQEEPNGAAPRRTVPSTEVGGYTP